MSDTFEDTRSLLQSFEEQLLEQSVRQTPNTVRQLLADEFVEFGSSGSVFNKQEIVDALANEAADKDPFVRSTSDFSVQALSQDVILITYRSVRAHIVTGQERHSLRSSVWKFIDGRWQMIFHQGTPTQGC
ncbi:DUF4440 domain-containing protein [Phyllobacterium myrsinacearum]|uniref:DUF4440 domain-containing protein n=1 Tax=Phyllobacterium myrsinacearum TaxID=28101 RepID=A0A839EHI1_9HYPH|nr:DUF4440 domain-containing protein [Phyllobacterium myrsinacearum]MBA8876926.1 hypothetical protein [Phyllobacterium myrsinacearum]